jgi:hypothetical protein
MQKAPAARAKRFTNIVIQQYSLLSFYCLSYFFEATKASAICLRAVATTDLFNERQIYGRKKELYGMFTGMA